MSEEPFLVSIDTVSDFGAPPQILVSVILLLDNLFINLVLLLSNFKFIITGYGINVSEGTYAIIYDYNIVNLLPRFRRIMQHICRVQKIRPEFDFC